MPVPKWLLRVLGFKVAIPPALVRFGHVLASAAFIAAGFGLYAFIAETDTLVCDRGTGQCTLTQATLTGTTVRRFPVAALTGAEIGARPTGMGGWRMRGVGGSSVVLLTGDEKVFLASYDSSFYEDQMKRQVEDVRRFVSTPSQAALGIRQDSHTLAAVAGGIVSLFGGAMLIFSLREKLRGK
ncbi:MAG: hypothetical protein HY039_09060 [Nitrospirae bacterium]|nr:hypothetical protein [Nitrospirota bacterium]